MIVQLLNDLKKMRDDMVARNYPFQQLSNLIVKYENLLDENKERVDTAIQTDNNIFEEQNQEVLDLGNGLKTQTI